MPFPQLLPVPLLLRRQHRRHYGDSHCRGVVGVRGGSVSEDQVSRTLLFLMGKRFHFSGSRPRAGLPSAGVLIRVLALGNAGRDGTRATVLGTGREPTVRYLNLAALEKYTAGG